LSSPGRPTGEANEHEIRFGDGGATVGEPVAAHADPSRTGGFRSGDRIAVSFDVVFDRDVGEPLFGFSCSTTSGIRLYTTTSSMLCEYQPPAQARERRRVEIEFDAPVAVGDLFLDVSVSEETAGRITVLDARLSVLHLTIAPPAHYYGLADVSASIRSSVRKPVTDRAE
jgi:hypothetical protein